MENTAMVTVFWWEVEVDADTAAFAMLGAATREVATRAAERKKCFIVDWGGAKWNEEFNPNRSLDRYSEVCYGEDNFLSSFILLLASCFLLVLTVARYAFEQTVNNLLNNLMKSVQDLMTDLG